MKKFSFTLEKLSRYKEQLLRREKNELARLRKRRQALVEEREDLLARFRQQNAAFAVLAAQGMPREELEAQKRFLTLLSEQARALEAQIQAMDTDIERQLGVVVEANREVASLDKLREGQLTAYRQAEQKAEEAFIEEFVANSSFVRQ